MSEDYKMTNIEMVLRDHLDMWAHYPSVDWRHAPRGFKTFEEMADFNLRAGLECGDKEYKEQFYQEAILNWVRVIALFNHDEEEKCEPETPTEKAVAQADEHMKAKPEDYKPNPELSNETDRIMRDIDEQMKPMSKNARRNVQ